MNYFLKYIFIRPAPDLILCEALVCNFLIMNKDIMLNPICNHVMRTALKYLSGPALWEELISNAMPSWENYKAY